MIILHEINGPECPKCGCRDSHRLGTAQWWGAAQEQRMCRHCGHRFSVAINQKNDVPNVASRPEGALKHRYSLPQCPECGGGMRVTSTRKTRRYLKCPECGKTDVAKK